VVSVYGLPATAWAGDGTFPTIPPGSPFAVPSPSDGTLGDLNGDGILDVAASTAQAPGGVTVRLGVGDGTFSPAVAGSPFGTQNECSVTVGDLNVDGKLDAAAPNCGPTANSVSLRFGDGAGAFTQQVGGTPLTTDISDPRAVAIGDFNQDGRPDLAISNFGSASLTIYLGSQFGTFPTATHSTINVMPHPRPVVIADFNGDGKQDLATGGGPGSGNPGSIWVLLGNGAGAFASAPGSPFATGPDPLGLAAADLDGDGHVDLASVDDDTNALTTYINDGTGRFPSQSSVQIANVAPREVAAGDFDSDGNVDLATAGTSGAAISIGNGSGAYLGTQTKFLESGFLNSVATGDLDSDGNVDLLLAGFLPSGLSPRLGGGTAPLAGNLLANGGFEGAGGGTGWNEADGMTFVPYGASPPDRFPAITDSPSLLTGGVNLLWGGNTTGSPGTSSASQTVDVSGSASQIDTGQGVAHLSAELGGAAAFDDRMSATSTYLDGSANPLGTFTIGPVTAADRKNLTTLLPRSGDAAIPAGTRAIRVTLSAVDSDSAPTYAFADNVKLTMDLPAPPPPPPPPPSAGGDTTPPTLSFAGKSTEKLAKFVKVKVAADEACAADVSGAISVKGHADGSKRPQRFQLKAKHVDLAAGAVTKVKLKLSAKARKAAAAASKGKAKIAVVASDPSGNQGSAKTTVRLR
jgi:hypothetical protein